MDRTNPKDETPTRPRGRLPVLKMPDRIPDTAEDSPCSAQSKPRKAEDWKFMKESGRQP